VTTRFSSVFLPAYPVYTSRLQELAELAVLVGNLVPSRDAPPAHFERGKPQNFPVLRRHTLQLP